jgi:hypothetical protein
MVEEILVGLTIAEFDSFVIVPYRFCIDVNIFVYNDTRRFEYSLIQFIR